jgi:hypothetical protein
MAKHSNFAYLFWKNINNYKFPPPNGAIGYGQLRRESLIRHEPKIFARAFLRAFDEYYKSQISAKLREKTDSRIRELEFNPADFWLDFTNFSNRYDRTKFGRSFKERKGLLEADVYQNSNAFLREFLKVRERFDARRISELLEPHGVSREEWAKIANLLRLANIGTTLEHFLWGFSMNQSRSRLDQSLSVKNQIFELGSFGEDQLVEFRNAIVNIFKDAWSYYDIASKRDPLKIGGIEILEAINRELYGDYIN